MQNAGPLPAKQSWDGTVVGLIPAGGKAERIAPLPCSKELLPIGFRMVQGSSQLRPKVVCHYLLERFQVAGITQAYLVLRKGKWDIPAYFGNGEMVDMHLGYLIMGESLGPPFTMDQAYPFVHDKVVAFGFPDILMSPKNIFQPLLDEQNRTQADVVLALFPAQQPEMMDMVEIDEQGRIHGMYLKPDHTDLRLCWLCGVWTPVFTQFMHEYLQEYRRENTLQLSKVPESKGEDLPVGAVLQAAIHRGLTVNGVIFSDGKYLDVGTPENLMKSIELYGCRSS
jgi:glucose-1-phosphate thymidylyltransferase